jgi:DNA-binding response OmpR family regulator
MRLLIIEDEWLVAHFIADIAIGQDIDVICIAQSYDEAIHILETESVDCAIVDINIKGSKHGIDVAQYLNTKGINFFFLTAYKDIGTIQEAIELKPLSYLIKPISEENLIAAFLIIKSSISTPAIQIHPFTIDDDGIIFKYDEILPLSQSERIVMALLIKNHRNVVPHETFFEHLWTHPNDINDGTLRNIILKLRKKFDLQIDNIKNVGYALVAY